MRIKKRWAALMLAVTLVCTQGNMVMAKVAPDGKTTASGTEFDEMLEKGIDAGENAQQLMIAPFNIKDNTTDEAEKKYLEYLKEIMDEERM